MRTKPITEARDKLCEILEQRDTITIDDALPIIESAFNDLRLAALYARNTTSKGFLYATNMSEDQIKETPQYMRIASLESGEGCTLEVAPELYKYIRWIVKRDNPLVRLRTLKLSDNVISVSRID